MYTKVGFIGSGNMAGAIIGGAVKSGYLLPENIYISDLDENKTNELKRLYGVNIIKSNVELVKTCEVIVLSVKPHIYKIVLDEIKEYVREDNLLVSIAAGLKLDYVKRFFNNNIKVIRTMPNTPALVGEGMTAVTYKNPVTKENVDFVVGLFSSFGLVEIIDEAYIDVFSSLCGSSPAFIDMFIEAMADAAVLMGLPRNKAYIMAAQAVKGSAKMVIETGKHPGELKDMVCSPAGTTIEGVRTLEEKSMRSAVIEALIKTTEKARDIANNYK